MRVTKLLKAWQSEKGLNWHLKGKCHLLSLLFLPCPFWKEVSGARMGSRVSSLTLLHKRSNYSDPISELANKLVSVLLPILSPSSCLFLENLRAQNPTMSLASSVVSSWNCEETAGPHFKGSPRNQQRWAQVNITTLCTPSPRDRVQIHNNILYPSTKLQLRGLLP